MIIYMLKDGTIEHPQLSTNSKEHLENLLNSARRNGDSLSINGEPLTEDKLNAFARELRNEGILFVDLDGTYDSYMISKERV